MINSRSTPRPHGLTAAGEMRGVQMRAPGALYHSGTDDDTDVGYGYDLHRAARDERADRSRIDPHRLTHG